MKSKSEQLTLHIAALKEAIRRKYRMFKDGIVETEKTLEKQYKPIIQELRKTTNPNIKMEQETVKEEPMDYDSVYSEDDFTPIGTSTPRGKPGQIEDIISTPAGLETASQYVKQYFNHPLTQEYMEDLMKDAGGKSRKIDHDYGPRFEDATLMIGDKQLEFDEEGAIIIDGVKYNPTKGLYELLFKRVPDRKEYSKEDLKVYKSILIATNAHKKGYKFHNQIHRTKNTKYTNILKTLFPVKSGRGLVWKSVKSHDLVHWDNPNELVSRLKLLVTSAESGHTSHSNEIINIIEELRESGYIKGAGNSRFKSLLQ